MLLMALLPMIALSVIGRNSLQSSLLGAQTSALATMHDLTTDALQNFLRETQTLVEVTARAAPITGYASAEGSARLVFNSDAQDQLQRLVALNPNFESATLVDERGQVVIDQYRVGGTSTSGEDVTARDDYRAARAGNAFISVPSFSTKTKKTAFYVAVPVASRRDANTVSGVVRLRIGVAALQSIVEGASSRAGTTNVRAVGRIFVVDQNGVIILDSANPAAILGRPDCADERQGHPAGATRHP